MLMALVAALAGCASVPGETTVSRTMVGEIRDKVLGMARAAEPGCKQPKVTNTEMLDVRSDGQSREELWAVDACGRPLNYLVSFPPKRPGFQSSFSVRPDR